MNVRSALVCAVLLSACSGSSGTDSTSTAGSTGSTTSASSTSGSTTTGSTSGSTTTAGSTGTDSTSASSGSTGSGSSGTSSASSAGSSSGSSGSTGNTATECSAARAQLLGDFDRVAAGHVSVVSAASGVTTLFVDGTGGGVNAAASNPYLFVDLATDTKVSVTDTTSVQSTGWDLAFKRAVIYVNGGSGGPGVGAAAFSPKAFDQVTAADAASATFATEAFFDADCNPFTDPTGTVETTLSTWYAYNQTTHQLMPASGTWLIKGGTGAVYKVAIQDYYGTPSGGQGTAGGNYLLKVEAL